MFFVYVLHSLKSNKYYIGQTQNINERIDRHNRGGVRSTKSGSPWSLILVEEYQTRISALRREKQIKSYKSGQGFKKLINSGISSDG